MLGTVREKHGFFVEKVFDVQFMPINPSPKSKRLPNRALNALCTVKTVLRLPWVLFFNPPSEGRSIIAGLIRWGFIFPFSTPFLNDVGSFGSSFPK